MVEGVNALIKELEEELAAEGLAPGEVEVGLRARTCVTRMDQHHHTKSNQPNQPTITTHTIDVAHAV